MKVLDELTATDLTRIVHIRNEPHSVIEALNRQVAHYAGHIGQIVFLGKHLKGPLWKTLSIAKGKSEAFAREMHSKKHEL